MNGGVFKRWARVAVVALGVLGVDGAAVAAPQSALTVDKERSTLVAKVQKGGLLRFLGHEHGVVPGAWDAEVNFDVEALEASSLRVVVHAPQLSIDTADARRLAGVDPDGPGEEDVQEIQAKMLSDEQLDAERFPAIEFTSTSLQLRGDDELRIEGRLTMRGISRDLRADAEFAPDGDGYVVRGELEIKLKDFDIEPVSIGGVVKVANEVKIRFEVYAAR